MDQLCHPELTLGIPGFSWSDLFQPDRLRDLDEKFLAFLEAADPTLSAEFRRYRGAGGTGYADKAVSDLIVRAGAHLGGFLSGLFGIDGGRAALLRHAEAESLVFEFKKKFIQGRVRKIDSARAKSAAERFPSLDDAVRQLRQAHAADVADDEEMAVAQVWKAVSSDGDSLAILEQWVAGLSIRDPRRLQSWASWKNPHALDYEHLVPIERLEAIVPESITGPDDRLRFRDGFTLTDRRMSPREVLGEIHYCLYCHDRDKDSCSKGLREKTGPYKKNPLGIELAGCPLDEKISEAHMLKRGGDSIAALAVVMIDNPMCPGTGHRICNDCMKACVFQKQDPVNIPEAETGILTDVLNLPWGVEIYGLLTRWNPLNAKRPVALGYNGKNILVVGMGPAGYTLAHYLLNEGFGVVGIDGLKIEPLPAAWLAQPIRNWTDIYKSLNDRILEGFGGVSEYGITVRWDKNFLTLIHLTLARRQHLRIYGGVRFGGTLTLDDAWGLGFDHVAIATGAGKPTVIGMKNNLIRGIRKASDFLMALQLTGAFKTTAMANLQVQLPAVVIGGGLTAIDTATELAAYYPIQVEKTLLRFDALVAEFGEDRVWNMYDAEERAILTRFVEHGRAVQAERRRASVTGEPPDFVKLVRNWGGVSIAYRKSMTDSPAYRLNHEEVIKSLEEGIRFVECMNPVEAVADEFGAVAAVRFERQRFDEKGRWRNSGEFVTLPARTVCVAAGTSPNIIYEKEKPGTFALDKWNYFFQSHRLVRDRTARLEPVAEGDPAVGFFTSYEKGGRTVTYYGDNHPVFAGNVVKAMASAKQGYPEVVALFAGEIAALDPSGQAERERGFRELARTLDDQLIARVVRVDRLTPTIVDVIVRAPLAARKFHPGQFYRLQNYESLAPVVDGTRLTMEGIALTGAWTDPENGLLSMIVLEMGVSSRLCGMLRPGEPVIVMGPTGSPTEIPTNETVLLAGGGLGNAVLFSIARALKARNNRVLYFAGYKRAIDMFKREEIEAATDQVVWSVDVGEPIEAQRPQDRAFVGNIVQSMKTYAEGGFGEPLFQFCEIDRIIAIGSDRMMGAVKVARRAGGALAPHMKSDHVAIGSINSPMQCMMKEVCAQCLQKHVDPETQAESGYVFSCFNQDQPLDKVDFKNLNDRLRANTVQEKLTNLWLDHLLARTGETALSSDPADVQAVPKIPAR